jgi:hypothetical protein
LSSGFQSSGGGLVRLPRNGAATLAAVTFPSRHANPDLVPSESVAGVVSIVVPPPETGTPCSSSSFFTLSEPCVTGARSNATSSVRS